MGNPITDTMFGLRDFGRRLLARPDALMLELGAGGELLVSQMRAALAMLLPLLPLINVIGGGKLRESMIGLLGAVFAIVMSQVWLALARQRGRYRWLPWLTTTYDVSTTTLVLALLAWESPVIGLNSMVVWVFYLVAICMTALRNDGRLTLYTGALAMLQYALLSACIFALVDSPDQPGTYAVSLRALQVSQGGAMAARLAFDVLERASERIRSEVKGVARVVYDLTPSNHYGEME